jgi:hypothetical protein
MTMNRSNKNKKDDYYSGFCDALSGLAHVGLPNIDGIVNHDELREFLDRNPSYKPDILPLLPEKS